MRIIAAILRGERCISCFICTADKPSNSVLVRFTMFKKEASFRIVYFEKLLQSGMWKLFTFALQFQFQYGHCNRSGYCVPAPSFIHVSCVTHACILRVSSSMDMHACKLTEAVPLLLNCIPAWHCLFILRENMHDGVGNALIFPVIMAIE